MNKLLKAVDYKQATDEEIRKIKKEIDASKDNYDLVIVNIAVSLMYILIFLLMFFEISYSVSFIMLLVTFVTYLIFIYLKFSLLCIRKNIYEKKVYIANVKCTNIMSTNKGKGTLLYTFDTGILHSLKIENPRHYGKEVTAGDECYLVSFNNRYYSLINFKK